MSTSDECCAESIHQTLDENLLVYHYCIGVGLHCEPNGYIPMARIGCCKNYADQDPARMGLDTTILQQMLDRKISAAEFE